MDLRSGVTVRLRLMVACAVALVGTTLSWGCGESGSSAKSEATDQERKAQINQDEGSVGGDRVPVRKRDAFKSVKGRLLSK